MPYHVEYTTKNTSDPHPFSNRKKKIISIKKKKDINPSLHSIVIQL